MDATVIASRQRLWPVCLLLAAFVAAGILYFLVVARVDGDDLSSSYVGCRLIAEGQQNHLYAHDPKNFAAIGPDDPWQQIADSSGYVSFLHPYVQTPLWGYALLPLCRHTAWNAFESIFGTLALGCFAALVFLVGRYWTPAMLRPVPLACVLVVLWCFAPFRYSMQLMQTHVFFVLATVAAVMLADRKRPVSAGLLLAVAATVKITPGVMIVYWLVRRQWRAAAAALGWAGALWMLTRVIAGPELMATYAATLDRVSHTLLLSMNNQSLAAWWMDHFKHVQFDSFEPLPLPNLLRIVCSALLVLTAALGGWMDGHREKGDAVPVGGLLAMVGATVFAPIEWTHYSIALIAPLMVLARYAWMRRAVWAWIVTGAVLLLNLPPLAANPYALRLTALAILRSHFYAEVICLTALLVLTVRTRARDFVWAD